MRCHCLLRNKRRKKRKIKWNVSHVLWMMLKHLFFSLFLSSLDNFAGDFYHTSKLNIHEQLNIYTDRRTETGYRYTRAPRHTHTHTHTLKQTIKVNHFSSDIQIKTKRSPEDCITGVVRAYDSFITVVWNADQARGTLLFTPEPLPTLLSYKSFFAFPRPACVCVFLVFFFTPFLVVY